MGKRLDLHRILKNLPEVKQVYFQPPSSEKIEYPCIVYEHDRTYKVHANNMPYFSEPRYQLTAICKDPDSPIFDAIERLPKCAIERTFKRDQLNHKVYNIYF